ncbi:hypothetical protein AKJ09_01244 [Labilithrix luteola]|uniref:Uncharacterized protein n=1 Tax=Labilithrix luteola TaxID=1391654 RepID=A0A0K1PM30_9BACT|nr:hypothetical protein AKJ09_01244 [Labilithrix luteola]
MTLAMHGLDARHALAFGAIASAISAFALRGKGGKRSTPGATSMAIVPWGMLVDAGDAPRILRWAAVRKIDVATWRAPTLFVGATPSSRVIVETDHDRFEGEADFDAPLERLVAYLPFYATEQAMPLARDLEGDTLGDALEPSEPSCEALLASASDWLATSNAAARLELPPAGYRMASARSATPVAVEALRGVLRDRTPRPADPRAFAAIVAAEIHASELAPELVALTQCPHPIVAAVAKQAARRLGVSCTKTGSLDEVAPFLFERDRMRLEAWGRG